VSGLHYSESSGSLLEEKKLRNKNHNRFGVYYSCQKVEGQV
jgi:hypothetical protein